MTPQEFIDEAVRDGMKRSVAVRWLASVTCAGDRTVDRWLTGQSEPSPAAQRLLDLWADPQLSAPLRARYFQKPDLKKG